MNNTIYKLGNNEDFNKQKEKQRSDIKSSVSNSQQIKSICIDTNNVTSYFVNGFNNKK